jgi:hypothetical protein
MATWSLGETAGKRKYRIASESIASGYLAGRPSAAFLVSVGKTNLGLVLLARGAEWPKNSPQKQAEGRRIY